MLTGPLYSNPTLPAVLAESIGSDHSAVDAHLDPAFVADVTAILIGHGHYDHLLDTPYVRTMTNDARVYGNVTVKHLLAGFAPEPGPGCEPPEAADWAPVPPDRVVAMNDPDDWRVDSRLCADVTICGGPWPDEAGAWEAVPNADVRLRALCSSHPAQFAFIHFGEGCVDGPLCSPPKDAEAWREGATLAWLVDFLDDEGAVTFRVYYQDAPTNSPSGHVSDDVLAEKRVDLAILNVGTWDQVDDHPAETIEALNPRYVLAGHWEDFFVAQSKPLEPIPLMDLDTFRERLIAAMPDDGTPSLRRFGADTGTRWWIPQPGADFRIVSE